MSRFKIYAALVLIVLVLIVILQNTTPVETKILFITITMPRAALLVITLLIGAVAGILTALGLGKKRTKKV